jgi:hypothetical protein
MTSFDVKKYELLIETTTKWISLKRRIEKLEKKNKELEKENKRLRDKEKEKLTEYFTKIQTLLQLTGSLVQQQALKIPIIIRRYKSSNNARRHILKI